MRKRLAAISFVALVLACSTGPASAAPLPPIDPLDVCGVIRLADWLPPRSLPPVAGMSGSAARQRDWPGQFAVVLDDVRGGNAPDMTQINGLLRTSHDGVGVRLGPGQLLLILAEDDPARLTGMKSLCVSGFVVSGDEGGTWTHHQELTTYPSDDFPGRQ